MQHPPNTFDHPSLYSCDFLIPPPLCFPPTSLGLPYQLSMLVPFPLFHCQMLEQPGFNKRFVGCCWFFFWYWCSLQCGLIKFHALRIVCSSTTVKFMCLALISPLELKMYTTQHHMASLLDCTMGISKLACLKYNSCLCFVPSQYSCSFCFPILLSGSNMQSKNMCLILRSPS